MIVLTFLPQFVAPILDGTKTQTIRPPRKRTPITAGMTLSLRKWTGKPYQSTQFKFATVKVTSVHEVMIAETLIIVDREIVVFEDAFAIKDGFSSAVDMRKFLRANYRLPFAGVLIKWRMIDSCTSALTVDKPAIASEMIPGTTPNN